MRSGPGLVVRSPPITPLVAHQTRVARCDLSSFTHISQQSKATIFSAPRYSQHMHLYQEGEEEIGFKKKEYHNNILENHPFKTAAKEEQGPHHDSTQQYERIRNEFLSQGGKKRGKEEEGKPIIGDGDGLIMRIEEEEEGLDIEKPRPEEDTGGAVVSRGRQIMKRSTVIAKQVISIHSALTLGFVSQLWVDTNAWVVLIVEVKPSLLSGELERFFLDDIAKVGDVVLVEDESVMENDFKLVGLETLVGYTVLTPGRRNIGKVRGYTFNINSGAVESLELDSFGISIIPSSLVSTYALFVEDVLEVLADTVVVHEAAASRIQRLTKGFWGAAQNRGDSVDEFEEYREYGGSRKRNLSSRKFPGEVVEPADDWELPMDYL